MLWLCLSAAVLRFVIASLKLHTCRSVDRAHTHTHTHATSSLVVCVCVLCWLFDWPDLDISPLYMGQAQAAAASKSANGCRWARPRHRHRHRHRDRHDDHRDHAHNYRNRLGPADCACACPHRVAATFAFPTLRTHPEPALYKYIRSYARYTQYIYFKRSPFCKSVCERERARSVELLRKLSLCTA